MIEPLDGVVVVDKPVGPTSFTVVRQARRLTGARRVGHGGTLDPLASGVLPLCFGEATKLAQFLLDADKEYEATICFGVETDTYDAAGTVTERRSAGHLTAEQVRAALAGFMGEQAQVPPMYSALKRDGRPLYAYARAGEILERTPRKIHIHALELRELRGSTPSFESIAAAAVVRSAAVDLPEPKGDVAGPSARVFVRCSKGTYVRSLAYDLGRALGTGAHLTGLRRTRSGPFGLDQAVSPEALGHGGIPVISLADALAHLAAVVAADDVALAIVRGQPVPWERLGPIPPVPAGTTPTMIRILTTGGLLLAVAPLGQPADLVRTVRVFRSAPAGSAAPPR